MIYDDDIRKAAGRAKGRQASDRAASARRVKREDDLTGVLKGNLDAELEGQVGGLTWHCSILDHRVAENPARNTSSGQTFSFTFDLMLDT